MIAIIDYGMGNVRSVSNALAFLDVEHELTCDYERIAAAEKLILPGVGSFGVAMNCLHTLGLVAVLNNAVLNNGKPVLGICLGMQLMAEKSFEDGEFKGLGWVPGHLIRIQPDDPSLKVPHVGWNTVRTSRSNSLMDGLPETTDFYFVHSYHLVNAGQTVTATTTYGMEIAATVEFDNIFGTQFHPEKSQDQGLTVLHSFAQL